jgi:arylsulfatase A-like enzyme
LYGAKATGYEGGQRVPAIFWAPGRIKPGVVSALGSTLDIFPTIASMAGIAMPGDRKYDGFDLTPTLQGAPGSPRQEMFYYHGSRIFAARKGAFKVYFYENNPDGYPQRMHKLDTLRLFNLQHDPSEKYDIAANNSSVIHDIEMMVEAHKATVDSVASNMERTIGNK